MISEMRGNHLDINSILIVPKVKEYLSRYKSSKVLDLFGYDISGRRRSLMLSLIKYFEASSENDERIKLYLPFLKESE